MPLGVLPFGCAIYAVDGTALSAVLRPAVASLGLANLQDVSLGSAQFIGMLPGST